MCMASKMQELIVFGLVYECVQPQTPVYRENGGALTEVPFDLPMGGAKQTRGTKRGRCTLSFVANNPCLCMQASARS